MAKIEGTADGTGEAAVEGRNSSTGPGVRGASGGTAVWGTSAEWVGVFGETGSTSGGAGVWGDSSTAAGVRGISRAPGAGGVEGRNDLTENPGPGVRGRSHGTGVWGESSGWVGVYGHSASTTGGAGVWGEHAGAGIGVRGKGSPAGYFEGDVVSTGDVVARGVSIEQLLVRIAQLEDEVRILRSKIPDATPVQPSSATPRIEVVAEGTSPHVTFVVTGAGFTHGKDVTIRVADDELTPPASFTTQVLDAQGRIGARIPIATVQGRRLHFSATDHRPVPPSVDRTGVLWSNTFTVIAP